eukprot:CAMPEP_0114308770 /NCGR_PEP_ID=MMETSP0059-20121206/18253_1 /TAXON_ID=36894 /ORGANISM="Pyramimonas parkeae, Strain CCMP726" /LENGTH=46 /DNA_ID= /DNA_START= /DNA_END= /DNA_ORIENTATION=
MKSHRKQNITPFFSRNFSLGYGKSIELDSEMIHTVASANMLAANKD